MIQQLSTSLRSVVPIVSQKSGTQKTLHAKLCQVGCASTCHSFRLCQVFFVFVLSPLVPRGCVLSVFFVRLPLSHTLLYSGLIFIGFFSASKSYSQARASPFACSGCVFTATQPQPLIVSDWTTINAKAFSAD